MKPSIVRLALVLVVLCAGICQARNATAFAVPLSGIKVDGKLDDWPAGMNWYPIRNHAQAYGPTDIDHADLATSPDLSPSFTVGFSLEENLIYVAVRVRDDTVAAGAADFWHTDACEVIVEGPHLSRKIASWATAGDSPALVYVMCPPGGSYGEGMHSADDSANPNIMGGDITKTRTKGAFAREGETSIYEWAVEPFDHYPDTPTRLEYGKTVGFEIFVVDKDRETDNAACLTWAPFGVAKRINTDLLGDLVLLKSDQEQAFLVGTVTHQTGNLPGAGLSLEVYSDSLPSGTVLTDAEGHYRLPVMPGTYTLKLKPGQGFASAEIAGLLLRAGQETTADLALTPVEVPAILRQVATAYQSLHAYRDTTAMEVHMVRPGMDNRMTMPMSLALARPNRLRLESKAGAMGGESAVVSDGVMLTSYQGTLKQYTQKKAPDQLALADLQSPMSGPNSALLVPKLLLSEDPLKELMQGVEEVREIGDEKLRDTPVIVLALTRPATSLGGGMVPPGTDTPIAVKLWIGKKDFLIRQVAYELDMSQMAQSLPAEQRAMMEGMKMGFTEQHTAIEINPDLPEATFAFGPPAEAKLVAEFGPPGSSQDKSEFVGKPAPPFVLRGLEGQEVSLADFAGKVLIVDFWATWCGPCKAELPTFAALQSQYAGQGFSLIGLSVDDSVDKVRPFAREHQINYPLLMADAKVREAYGNISAIPTTFVIDKKGIVRYTHMGSPPDLLIFQRQVEELLAE